MRWARTLDHYVTLQPETLVREFGPEVHGRAAIAEVLTTTADALRWLRAATVERLNRGWDVDEIVADLDYPPEWADMAWMAPTYGHPDYIIRDIYRSETGWWDRNITHLHPAPAADAAAAVRSAIADADHVIETATRLRADGELQLALHVLDLLALDAGDETSVTEARRIKTEIGGELADGASSFISANLYRTMADYPHERAAD
jgi:uncharacterized sulfatase